MFNEDHVEEALELVQAKARETFTNMPPVMQNGMAEFASECVRIALAHLESKNENA